MPTGIVIPAQVIAWLSNLDLKSNSDLGIKSQDFYAGTNHFNFTYVLYISFRTFEKCKLI